MSTNLSLPSVFSCGVINSDDAQALTELQDELHDTWNKRQVFRTETEMRVSVLNDGAHPTEASKYWQAVREQAVMLDNLAVHSFDYRRNELKLKRLYEQLESTTGEFDREELQIDIEELQFRQASLRQIAGDRVREIKLWSRIKQENNSGKFDTTDVNTHQLESYLHTFKNRANTLTQGSSQPEVLNVLGQLRTAERMISEKGL